MTPYNLKESSTSYPMEVTMNPVNFAALMIPEDRLLSIYEERLAYRVAYDQLGLPLPKISPAAYRYARVIAWLEETELLSQFEAYKETIRIIFNAEAERIKLDLREFAQDDTWINWDMAKQLFCCFSNEIPFPTERYRLANPFQDPMIRDEIISRHVGWEIYQYNYTGSWSYDERVASLLTSHQFISSEGEKYGPASWALAEIGQIARQSTEFMH